MSTIKYDLSEITAELTTVSGSAEVSLQDGLAELSKQIICNPATSSTIYTFALVNANDADTIVYERDADGSLNDLTELPLYGNYKVKITSATADELFKVRILHI